MHFELDLAIAYACSLALLGWLSFWLLPLAFGALVRAIVSAIEAWRARDRRGTPSGGDSDPRASDWWGPTHHSH